MQVWRNKKLNCELTQIKRHRGGETGGRQKGSLTHGKKTPAIRVNEHESGTENGLVAQAASALSKPQSCGQKPAGVFRIATIAKTPFIAINGNKFRSLYPIPDRNSGKIVNADNRSKDCAIAYFSINVN
jgi:hypothetical protein